MSDLEGVEATRCVPAIVGIGHAMAVYEARAMDYDEHLGVAHLQALHARWDFALCCLDAGRRTNAKNELDHLAHDCDQLLPPGDPLTLFVRRGVEAVRNDPLLPRETPYFGVSTLGERHPLSLRAGWVRAHVLLADAHPLEAMNHCERLVIEASSTLGPDALVTLLACSAQASALWALDRRDEALAGYEEVARHCERALGSGHLETLRAWGVVAGVYADVGRAGDSLAVLERLETESERALGHDHPFTRAVRERGMAVVLARPRSPARLGDGATYDGPYVAASGGTPVPWLWVANGTKPSVCRFAIPRPSSERGAVPPDSLAAWLARAAARQGGVAGDAVEISEAAPNAGPDAAEPTTGSGEAVEEGDRRSSETLEAPGEISPGPGATLTVASGSPRVDLLVLGPVEATGWEVLPERPVVVELVCFLALHRNRRLHGDELRAALRPEGTDEVSATTLRSYVSFLRRSLPPGLLPSATGGGYRLAEAVSTDWERFVVLAAPGASVDQLRDALLLVRGRPFAGVPAGTYQWVYAELLVSDMEVAIADAARRLTEAALAADDVALAIWAIRQGLAGAPSDFGLWRLHLDLAAREGPAAVERARRDAVAALGSDADELIDGPDPTG